MRFLIFLLLLTPPLGARYLDVREEVRRVVSQLAESDVQGLWSLAAELEALAKEDNSALGVIEDELTSSSVTVRLGCAKALLAAGEPEEAERALRLIADSREPTAVRIAALRLLRSSLDEALPPVLSRLAARDPEPLIRISAARTL